MGLSSSTCRLLALTGRKNAIGLEETRLSNEKVSLSRDMQRVSKKYQDALNEKVLKWSNNSGVSYVDLSYQNLMKPSSMNQNTPYLLTDHSDRVIVDSQYKKYAEMISANGNPGDWESVRTKVLSDITGIDANKIENENSYWEEIWANEAVINDLIENEKTMPTKGGSIESFLQYSGLSSTGTGGSFSKGENWADAYSKGGTIDLGGVDTAVNNLQQILDTIYAGLEPYLIDDECKEALKSGCEAFMNSNKVFIEGNDEKYEDSLKADFTAISGNSNNYKVNVTNLIDSVLSNIPKDTATSGVQTLDWADIKSSKYQDWVESHALWEAQYESAKKDYDTSVEAKNQLFTADEESLIAFYDAIFSAIAERGWTSNEQVNDTNYLNQMLQNGLYTITTVERKNEYDDNSGEYVWNNDYKTDIASNFKNVFIVNDTSAREQALVEYEHEKNIINAKETKIDTRMKNLETELAAINQMLQGIEQVKNDNIDRTMNTFA